MFASFFTGRQPCTADSACPIIYHEIIIQIIKKNHRVPSFNPFLGESSFYWDRGCTWLLSLEIWAQNGSHSPPYTALHVRTAGTKDGMSMEIEPRRVSPEQAWSMLARQCGAAGESHLWTGFALHTSRGYFSAKGMHLQWQRELGCSSSEQHQHYYHASNLISQETV